MDNYVLIPLLELLFVVVLTIVNGGSLCLLACKLNTPETSDLMGDGIPLIASPAAFWPLSSLLRTEQTLCLHFASQVKAPFWESELESETKSNK